MTQTYFTGVFHASHIFVAVLLAFAVALVALNRN